MKHGFQNENRIFIFFIISSLNIIYLTSMLTSSVVEWQIDYLEKYKVYSIDILFIDSEM